MKLKLPDSFIAGLTTQISISAKDKHHFAHDQLQQFNAKNGTNTDDTSLKTGPEHKGTRDMDKLDILFIPIIFLFRIALILFTLGKHVINCMFTNILYITSQKNGIMYTLLALEEYVLCQALLALIYIAYHGSLTSMNILQTFWLAFTFGPNLYWSLLGPQPKGTSIKRPNNCPYAIAPRNKNVAANE